MELKEVARFGTSLWAVYLPECKVGLSWTVERMKTILLRAVIDSPDVSSYYIFHVCCHNVKTFLSSPLSSSCRILFHSFQPLHMQTAV